MKNAFVWPWTGFKPEKKTCETLGGTYMLRHIKTGGFYVGSTRNIYGRLYKHVFELRNKIHGNTTLQQAFDDDPVFEVTFILLGDSIHSPDLEQHCWAAEQKLLDEHAGDELLMNVATVASSPFKGLVRTEAHRENISKALAGHEVPLATRNKIKAAWNDELREKIGALKRGIPRSEETKKKISDAHVARNGGPKPPHVPYPNRKHLEINGVTFIGIKEAALGMGLHPKTIQYRLKSPNFPGYREKAA